MKRSFILIWFVFMSCEVSYMPKQKAYLAHQFKKPTYKQTLSNCDYKFLININSKIKLNQNCNAVINYESLKANIFLTNLKINNNFNLIKNDFDLKVKIIKKKILEIESQFKENININEEVINYIANESKTSIRELIGILNRVIAFSRVHNKTLTMIDCKNILKDVFNQIKIITVDKIQNVVSNYFNIPLNDMLSQRRSRPLARPRQIAMYLAKKMTTRSLPEIGRRFANRDHTTVIHAVKTITRLSEQDDEMKKNINQIKNLLLE